MKIVNREQCLGCPDRPSEGKVRSCLSKLLLGNDYRPETCAVGSQVTAEHLNEAHSPIIGFTGIVGVQEEVVCGKNGAVENKRTYDYANGSLYRIQEGEAVVFFNPKAIPPHREDYTETDVYLELGCYEF